MQVEGSGHQQYISSSISAWLCDHMYMTCSPQNYWKGYASEGVGIIPTPAEKSLTSSILVIFKFLTVHGATQIV